MVLQKRLDYGSRGHQVPVMPRVPRSARGKRSVRKKVEDKQMCAFDLLATVAGELLSERETSTTPCKISGTSNPSCTKDAHKEEQADMEKSFKPEVFDQGSCNESTLGGSEIVFKRQGSYHLKENPQNPKAEESNVEELMYSAKDSEFGHSATTSAKKCSTYDCKVEIGLKTPLQAERRIIGNVDGNASEILEDPMDLDVKPPPLISSDSSVEVPMSHKSCFPKFGDNRDLSVDRDDDEKSSGCTHPSTKTSKGFRPQRIGDRRIRKLLASKYWRVGATALNNEELANTDTERKPVYRSRKMCYTRQRTQRCAFKRRKLYESCSISASEGKTCNEGTFHSLKLGGIKIEASDSHAGPNGANGASSSTSGQKSSYESRDYHVKLSIKSFKVPELFVEMPESATVGSLKRTVMEAVTAILSGGLRVGVLLQGKKVRDDNKTLLQAGISQDDQIGNLGFTLEPNPTQTPPPLTCQEDPNNFLLPCDTEPLKRIPAAAPALEQCPSQAMPQPPQTLTSNCPESDHDSVQSPTDASSVDKIANSKALVTVPDMSVEALAMVPMRKSRRSELAQRRIRRPFTVSEVEALVHAVEKLGTGRWRDVKIRAFDNAKHRTYVDLKDKWKTLVHTARISPQQRRGEPVPQELLDRVLAAHAYWSQQQAKLQVKTPSAETCLLL